MEDIAYVTIPPELFPANSAALVSSLRALDGASRIEGESVRLELDGVTFLLTIVTDTDPPGLDVAADEGDGDVVGELINFTELIEAAFPGAEVSSAWDE